MTAKGLRTFNWVSNIATAVRAFRAEVYKPAGLLALIVKRSEDDKMTGIVFDDLDAALDFLEVVADATAGAARPVTDDRRLKVTYERLARLRGIVRKLETYAYTYQAAIDSREST